MRHMINKEAPFQKSSYNHEILLPENVKKLQDLLEQRWQQYIDALPAELDLSRVWETLTYQVSELNSPEVLREALNFHTTGEFADVEINDIVGKNQEPLLEMAQAINAAILLGFKKAQEVAQRNSDSQLLAQSVEATSDFEGAATSEAELTNRIQHVYGSVGEGHEGTLQQRFATMEFLQQQNQFMDLLRIFGSSFAERENKNRSLLH